MLRFYSHVILVSNDAPMRDGELVLVDAGAVYVTVLQFLSAYLSADWCVLPLLIVQPTRILR
jgi:hypothetical protein